MILFLELILDNLTPFSPYTESERKGLERAQWFSSKGQGYSKEQGTQPQTLGYSLADSPAGLLAWIYEKLVNWTDNYQWEDDEVLTWVSIYWFSRAGPASSLRIYYEIMNDSLMSLPYVRGVPLGVSYYPKEVAPTPRSWTKAFIGEVVFESEHASGGHFAAYEEPEAFVDDLRKMFGKGGPSFGVVPGLTGYKL
ncbi:alpha/beta-hydrolase [Heliocybe sulcata]|uniref:Alpha/beta-hydrolase n=1 Tax=Heliocybe sulcata TaxID=5364 RepID=A0A5C3MUI2_9AGAM|nr:alpha/beta-hydrolase [Heliocybe sulcata]